MTYSNCWILLEASFADIRVASCAIRVLNGNWLRVSFDDTVTAFYDYLNRLEKADEFVPLDL